MLHLKRDSGKLGGSAMKSLQGQLLIASSKLFDPNFFRSVVLLVKHDEDGALGLILNRPLEMTIKDAWEQVADSACEIDAHLYHGGPCDGPLMVLHTNPTLSEIQVSPSLHFSTEKSSVEQLLGDGQTPIKFFVGYAGWSPGQLENEMAEGGWLLAPATLSQVFTPPDDLWDQLRRANDAPSIIDQVPPHLIPPDPTMN